MHITQSVCGKAHRLTGGELGHSLGALRHCVLGQLAGKDEAHRCLDLAGGHGGLLVVAGKVLGLAGNLVEDIVDEGVPVGPGQGGRLGRLGL